jgi:hypothetical protein
MDLKVIAPLSLPQTELEGCHALLFFDNQMIDVPAKITGHELVFEFNHDTKTLKRVVVMSATNMVFAEINTGGKDDSRTEI